MVKMVKDEEDRQEAEVDPLILQTRKEKEILKQMINRRIMEDL